ncbi:undecaprenyldiphospho-muramoylpentapeptide beta-N- acetylglucosaminyltransferase [Marinibacterium anthonyi]|nr:undecaprenyldiphospho-muramoylpentapeptide beta-N- acetylglucosaminyltransferase [Marinibacterium anthonyi]
MIDADADRVLKPGTGAMRVMLYSHDTFGLGHLRRTRALASAITEADPTASALIVTGSPVAGRFAFPPKVDHIRLPGVTKLADGSYASQALGLDIDETTDLRASLIEAAATVFKPDLLIVDKEPTGFRGELMPTLDRLVANGRSKLVLGLRDVLDEPEVLVEEWGHKGAVEAAERYYHELWVYGLRSIYDPTAALPFSQALRERMVFTGYLRRDQMQIGVPPAGDYVLVTPGGGGDGQTMVNLVLSAYEADPTLSPRAILVYGPFLSGDTRAEFERRVKALHGRVEAVGFESQIETLIAGASGVICMGGYNTFCEVLTFDRPAVIVPRTVPRREQYIRARRAEEMGLVGMIDEWRDGLTTEAMIAAIRGLTARPQPSQSFPPGLLDGLDHVTERVASLLALRRECAAE